VIRIFKDLLEYKDLLYMITWREVSIKYKQSMMGLLWAILMPILIVLAGVSVKFVMAKFTGVPLNTSQLATIAMKSLPWSFFIASLRFSTISLTTNVPLVTKISFPKEIFPFAAVFSQMVDFAVALIMLTAVLFYLKVGISVQFLFVPLYLFLLVVLSLAFGMLLSAANLFYRDVKYIVEVVVTFAIFFTPVFYEADMLGSNGKYLMLNPIAPILEGLNDCVVRHVTPNLFWLLYTTVFSVVFFVLGSIFFKKLEPIFAEKI
jgi:lipopolysaccharide transport system permease protein